MNNTPNQRTDLPKTASEVAKIACPLPKRDTSHASAPDMIKQTNVS